MKTENSITVNTVMLVRTGVLVVWWWGDTPVS